MQQTHARKIGNKELLRIIVSSKQISDIGRHWLAGSRPTGVVRVSWQSYVQICIKTESCSYLGLDPPSAGLKSTFFPFESLHEHVSILSQLSPEPEEIFRITNIKRAHSSLRNAIFCLQRLSCQDYFPVSSAKNAWEKRVSHQIPSRSKEFIMLIETAQFHNLCKETFCSEGITFAIF